MKPDIKTNDKQTRLFNVESFENGSVLYVGFGNGDTVEYRDVTIQGAES